MWLVSQHIRNAGIVKSAIRRNWFRMNNLSSTKESQGYLRRRPDLNYRKFNCP